MLNSPMMTLEHSRVRMTLALNRAGFVHPSLRRVPGVAGERFLVEAKKPEAPPLPASNCLDRVDQG